MNVAPTWNDTPASRSTARFVVTSNDDTRALTGPDSSICWAPIPPGWTRTTDEPAAWNALTNAAGVTGKLSISVASVELTDVTVVAFTPTETDTILVPRTAKNPVVPVIVTAPLP